MNAYQALEAMVALRQCPTCKGIGQCDDLEPGDMSGNTWTCTDCSGHGLTPDNALTPEQGAELDRLIDIVNESA